MLDDIFATGMMIIGIIFIMFAQPIATWDYKIDTRWKITSGVRLGFRIWFFRIVGTALIVLTIHFAKCYCGCNCNL
ncbi:hypothetical protein ACFLVC_02250 [Chloroflexota bacterium]